MVDDMKGDWRNLRMDSGSGRSNEAKSVKFPKILAKVIFYLSYSLFKV